MKTVLVIVMFLAGVTISNADIVQWILKPTMWPYKADGTLNTDPAIWTKVITPDPNITGEIWINPDAVEGKRILRKNLAKS